MPRVLVVDDDPMVCVAIEVCLTRKGFEVTVADVDRITPTFVRITFEGPSLRDFPWYDVLGPRDLRIKLL